MYLLAKIENDYESFNRLIDFFRFYENMQFSDIDLNITGYFAANQASTLGALLEKLALNINNINITIRNPKTQEILQKNQFLCNYGFEPLFDNNNTTIPFQKFNRTESRRFTEYIINELMPRNDMPTMSNDLKLKIINAITEIFANSNMHTDTPYIFACGQFYPQQHVLDFTISDMGEGIKPKVSHFLKKEIDAIEAIKWALIDGNTTKMGTPGGYGLSILRELIKLNNGFMQVVSNDGFYEYKNRGIENSRLLKNSFPGTVINLQFRTDDMNSYSIKK